MKFVSVLVALVLLSSYAFGQKTAREQKVQTIIDLRSQITALEKEVMLPESSDVDSSEKVGASAIRLLPREKYDHVLAINGGGAYYSFARKTNEYGYGSDISLQQGKFSVGFAGADYGFLKDLGEVSLASIDRETTEVEALLKYVPPTDEPTIRAEYQKLARIYELSGISFTSRVPAAVGHSYLLRSISPDRSDILVAFSVLRKDSDGSVILLWKPIETFPKPEMRREKAIAIQ